MQTSRVVAHYVRDLTKVQSEQVRLLGVINVVEEVAMGPLV